MNKGKRRGAAASAACALLFAMASATCGGADGETGGDTATPAEATPSFDGSAAYELLTRQVDFGPRIPGSEGHRAMAEWVESYLGSRADTLLVQRFEHQTTDGVVLPLANFLARFRHHQGGASILLLAHWDTRPTADQAPDPDDRAKPVPGANDGASGTAVLLQLAEMFVGTPPPRAVDLLLVDGEDYGDFGEGKDVFLGSRHFAANLPDGWQAEYGILLDMVGDRDLDIYVEGNSNRLAPEVVDRVWNLAHRMGFGDVFHREVHHTVNDDHIPLNDAGVPTIDIIDFDYRGYWHTPEDTPDKVSASSLGIVGSVLTRLIFRGR